MVSTMTSFIWQAGCGREKRREIKWEDEKAGSQRTTKKKQTRKLQQNLIIS